MSAAITIPQLKKDFTTTLNKLSHSRHPSTVFSDWLEVTAICLHQTPYEAGDFSKDDDDYQRLERSYLETVKGYSGEDLNSMSRMLGMTLLAHRICFGDFLGELAGENELLNQHNGQFFTPYAVCRLMSQMTMTDAHEVLDRQGIITVSDPAVGGGAQLIAVAETLLEQGIDARSAAQFDAIDVSRNAFNMAYIQLSALDLQAMVRHGNTLSMEMWESRPTPQLRYFNEWLEQKKTEARLVWFGEFFKDPDAFFARNRTPDEAASNDAITVPVSQESEDADQREAEQPQINLFETNTFIPDSETDDVLADYVMPPQQLDIFSAMQDGNSQP